MNKYILLLLFFLGIKGKSYSQKDSTMFLKSVEEIPRENLVVIIDVYVFYDTTISYPLLIKYDSLIEKKRYYTMKKAKKRLNIISKNGILVCILRLGKRIEFANPEKYERIKSQY